jgi:tetratricopeptide (TPR) repeat protein
MPLRMLLTTLFLLQAIAAFLPGPALWGVHHLAYAPLPLRFGVPLLGLAVVWTRAGRTIGRVLSERLAPAFFRRGWMVYGLAPAAGAIGFWLLRCRTHFLGDGWLLGELVQRRLPFHGFDFVDYHLHARLYQALGYTTEPQAFALYAALSVAAGALYLIVAGWGARRLTPDPGERILLYVMLAGSATVQLFMGYVEAYSFLTVGLLLFVLMLVGHYRCRIGAHGPGIALGLAVLFHLDALFLAPLLLLALLRPPAHAPASFARRLVALFAPLLGGLLLGAGILASGGYGAKWLALELGNARSGANVFAPLTGETGWLGLRHAKDVVNLLLLLSPVPLAWIAALAAGGATGAAAAGGGAGTVRGLWRSLDRGERVFATGCAWLVALMLVLNLRLGAVRDWDIFAGPSLVFVALAFMLGQRRLRDAGAMIPAADRQRLVGLLAVSTLLLGGPWFWVNAGETRSVRRFEQVVSDLPRFARAYAYEEIGKYYRKTDRAPQALEAYRACVRVFPDNPRFHGVLGALLYSMQDMTGARDEFLEAYARDSTMIEPPQVLAKIYADWDRFPEALAWARKIADAPHEPARSAALHGAIAEELGLLPEAIAAYRSAARKEPGQLDWLEHAGGLALGAGDYGQAEELFRDVLRRDRGRTASMIGLLVAGCERLRGSPGEAAGETGRARLRELIGISDLLDQRGEADPQLRAYREQLRRLDEQLTRGAKDR